MEAQEIVKCLTRKEGRTITSLFLRGRPKTVFMPFGSMPKRFLRLGQFGLVAFERLGGNCRKISLTKCGNEVARRLCQTRPSDGREVQ